MTNHTLSPDDAQAIRDGRMTAVLAVLDPQPPKNAEFVGLERSVPYFMVDKILYPYVQTYTTGDTLTDEAGTPVARVTGSEVKQVQGVTFADVQKQNMCKSGVIGVHEMEEASHVFLDYLTATHGPDAWASNVVVQIARVEAV